jgi:cell division protein FtsW
LVENVLVGAVALLCALSVVMVQSASSVYSMDRFGSPWTVVIRHGAYVGLGVLAAVMASRIPLRVWKDRLTIALLVTALVCLVLVQVPGLPISPARNGAHRWLEFGPIGFQPSELAKLALVLWLARLLSVHRDLSAGELLKRSLVALAPLAGLVLAGDDLGTALLLGVILVAMLYLAGLPFQHLAMVSGAGLAAASMVVVFKDGFRAQRIMAFLQPDEHAATGYQVLQSRIGFASGGLWGVGPGSSRVKWGYLPEAHTDFILAVLGEELGLFGTLVVIACLVAVVGSAIAIGSGCDDLFGRYTAWGIAVWFAVQALINVGVGVGAMPTKGIPLPFMSYGGTSMVVSLLAVGVLFSVSRSGHESSPTPARSASRTASQAGRGRRS